MTAPTPENNPPRRKLHLSPFYWLSRLLDLCGNALNLLSDQWCRMWRYVRSAARYFRERIHKRRSFFYRRFGRIIRTAVAALIACIFLALGLALDVTVLKLIGALALLGVFVYWLYRYFRQENMQLALRTSGLRRALPVSEVRRRPFGRKPYTVWVRCKHPTTGETVALHSTPLRNCLHQPGEQVLVFFSKDKPEDYFIDLHDPMTPPRKKRASRRPARQKVELNKPKIPPRELPPQDASQKRSRS